MSLVSKKAVAAFRKTGVSNSIYSFFELTEFRAVLSQKTVKLLSKIRWLIMEKIDAPRH